MADKIQISCRLLDKHRKQIEAWGEANKLNKSKLFAQAAQEFLDWYEGLDEAQRSNKRLLLAAPTSGAFFRGYVPKTAKKQLDEISGHVRPYADVYYTVLSHFYARHEIAEIVLEEEPEISPANPPTPGTCAVALYPEQYKLLQLLVVDENYEAFEKQTDFYEAAVESWLSARAEAGKEEPYVDYISRPTSERASEANMELTDILVVVPQEHHQRVVSYAETDHQSLRNVYHTIINDYFDKLLDQEPDLKARTSSLQKQKPDG